MLLHAFTIFAIVAASVVAVPAVLLLLECVAALLPRRAGRMNLLARPRLGVIIPAHDEQLLIADTVRSILPQLAARDRLLVVADNCSDATAAEARAAGAHVVERADALHRGKGHALAAGIDCFRDDAPEIILFFDADVPITTGVIDRLVEDVVARNRPVQAAYVLRPAATDASPVTVVSSLAFVVKNIVRPTGLSRLGLPVPLTGTGMAFPWALIQSASLGGSHLVEDMQLGITMLLRNAGPVFCPAARIEGSLPADAGVALVQRTRWEHGHLGVIRSASLPLLSAGMKNLSPTLILTAFDYAIPPLAFLVGLIAATAVPAAAVAVLGGGFLALFIIGLAGISVIVGVAVGWIRFAPHLPPRALLSIPRYILWKVPMYAKFFNGPQTAWVRTQRNAEVRMQNAE